MKKTKKKPIIDVRRILQDSSRVFSGIGPCVVRFIQTEYNARISTIRVTHSDGREEIIWEALTRLTTLQKGDREHFTRA